jgi:alpha-tubulin suppressor-like RCC1 family protein
VIRLPKAILGRHYAPFCLLLILGASCTNRDLPFETTSTKPAFAIQDATTVSGTVWAWGWNGYGQLGNGTYTNSNTPVQVLDPASVSGYLTGVTALAGGASLSLALKSDGTVWAWGYGLNGELGNGTYTTSNTPVQVSGLSGVTAIAEGGAGFNRLALKSDGTVWAWGYNGYGELGNGTYTTSNTPVQVSGLSGVTAIGVGGYHGLALKSDGTIWAWGDNGYGELGNGTYTTSNTPVQVSGLSGVTALAGGGWHSLALKSDGTVWAWGRNSEGQLGNGTYTNSNTPVQVLGLSGGTAIAGGYLHSLALTSDGTVWAWGYNSNGQLGNGTYTFSINTPVQVLGPGGVGDLTGVTELTETVYSSLALKGDGTVWAWGDNGYGELGNGTYTGSNTPVQVSGLAGVTAIAGGGAHNLALEGATPAQAINSLIGQVISPSLGFSNGEKTSLTAKLQTALGYLGAGDTADAIAVLQAFINEVNALVNSGRLTAAAAAPLISAAEGIIAEL